MRRRPFGRSLILSSALAVVVAGFAACGSSAPSKKDLVANGQVCGPEGSGSCASGHCANGFCCAAGDCCSIAADCPSTFGSPPTCTSSGSSTTCQGTRLDAACQGSICTVVTVDDDSACDGAVRDCGAYPSTTCTAATDQVVATCASSCTGPADCTTGYTCDGAGKCMLIGGTGDPCTGAGQGTCLAGLRCENGLCCDATATGACCNTNDQCANGLACDTASHACYTTCTNNDSSRCASPPTSYCTANTCVPKLPQADACTDGRQCTSGNCAQGVCCNIACAGACDSCNHPSIPLSKGTCTRLAPGTFCNDGSACTSGDTCDGGGTCVGTPYSCGASSTCVTRGCNGDGTCFAINNNGAACGNCGTCSSGSCVGDCGSLAQCCFPGCAPFGGYCP